VKLSSPLLGKEKPEISNSKLEEEMQKMNTKLSDLTK
jgi:hypothetical protein